MIERYSRPKLRKLWSDENRFQTWLDVELAVLSQLEKRRMVPKGVSHAIRKKSKIKVARILELEKKLKHDVIAFTTSIAEQSGDAGRFFHYGLTSSDVVDTALSLLLKQSLAEISIELARLISTTKKLAIRYKNLASMGRTHGVHAEPTSFGMKFLGFYVELKRQQERIESASKGISFGKLSGAVGIYGILDPLTEKNALKELGLNAEPVATQVLPRDRHAEVFSALALLGGTIERICVELRHLQRTEVLEAEEGFGEGQKGSSAMPHKKNPISAENLTGCARLLRGYSQAAIENIALWHERDISHSSVERVIGPDATMLADYMLARLNELLQGLKVNPGNIKKNLELTQGIYYSGHVLLKCVEKGLSREEAYLIVQKAAHDSWKSSTPFMNELLKAEWMKKNFKRTELTKLFDVRNYLKNVPAIYKRAFELK